MISQPKISTLNLEENTLKDTANQILSPCLKKVGGDIQKIL